MKVALIQFFFGVLGVICSHFLYVLLFQKAYCGL
jgi:hypothetical protein